MDQSRRQRVLGTAWVRSGLVIDSGAAGRFTPARSPPGGGCSFGATTFLPSGSTTFATQHRLLTEQPRRHSIAAAGALKEMRLAQRSETSPPKRRTALGLFMAARLTPGAPGLGPFGLLEAKQP